MLKTICTGKNAIGVAGIYTLNRAPYTISVEAYGTGGTITGAVSVSNSGDKWIQLSVFTVTPGDAATIFVEPNPYEYTQISITSITAPATLTAIAVC